MQNKWISCTLILRISVCFSVRSVLTCKTLWTISTLHNVRGGWRLSHCIIIWFSCICTLCILENEIIRICNEHVLVSSLSSSWIYIGCDSIEHYTREPSRTTKIVCTKSVFWGGYCTNSVQGSEVLLFRIEILWDKSEEFVCIKLLLINFYPQSL